LSRLFWTLVAGVVLISLAASTAAIVSRAAAESTRAQAEALRDEVRQTRTELEWCLEERHRREAAFRRQEERTRELRSFIDRMEDLDPRGVPAEQYETYLEAVDEYNESLPEWDRRAEVVEQLSATCRELAEDHNLQADSLRTFLLEEGLLGEDWRPPGVTPVPEAPTGEELPEAGDPLDEEEYLDREEP
jgi:hypothetical protein